MRHKNEKDAWLKKGIEVRSLCESETAIYEVIAIQHRGPLPDTGQRRALVTLRWSRDLRPDSSSRDSVQHDASHLRPVTSEWITAWYHVLAVTETENAA